MGVRGILWMRVSRGRRRRRTAGSTLCATVLSATMCCMGLAGTPAHALEVNLATASELQVLRGVGPKMAERVIQERERAGPFTSLDDLSERVRGIGAKRLASFRAAGLTASTSAVPAQTTRSRNPAQVGASRHAAGAVRSKARSK